MASPTPLDFDGSSVLRSDKDRADWPVLRLSADDCGRPTGKRVTNSRSDHADNDSEVGGSIPFPNAGPSPSDNSHAPLGAEHHEAIQAANLRAKKIARAVRVAGFNGWATGILATFSLLFGILSWSSLVIGAVLAFISYNEFRGRNSLRHVKPEAANILGWNEVFLVAIILLYSAWGMYGVFAAPPASAQYAQYGPEVQGMMQPYDSIYSTASIAMYAGIAFFGLVIQGSTALYYFSRRKYIVQYLRETPEWIVELQQSKSSF